MKNSNILDFIPHKQPFILVDKIIDFEAQKRAVGIKNVSINDPYIQGHFADFPVMPNSLIIEALAQTASAIFFKDPEFTGQLPIFTDIQSLRFSRQAFPGDQIRLETEIIKNKDNKITVEARALTDGKLICEGDITFAFSPTPSRPQIHPTASVHSSASLGKDTVIGPYAIIGENVVIGDNTVIEAHTMIEKDCRIGEDCTIHFGAVIGSKAQDVKSKKDERSYVIIGDRNEIREYVTINKATGHDAATIIGNDNLLMTHIHIGHNCVLGNNVVMVSNAMLAGHCEVEDNVTIGGLAGIHQFCRLGKGAMIGGYARVAKDVPPFCLCEGDPANIRNINLIGLKRRGVSREAIAEIKMIFKEIYRSNKNFTQAITQIKSENIVSEEAKYLLNFCETPSNRGLILKSAPEKEQD